MSSLPSRANVPQLLVSVRNAAEALAALAGGCDVLDVKEPLRGPLGMADPKEIAAVLVAARQWEFEVPVSAALGDARDWESTSQFPQVPKGLKYLKLGTAGLAARSDWAADWLRIAGRWGFDARSRQSNDSRLQPLKSSQHEEPHWILVAYADWRLAAAPAPVDVIRVAGDLGCFGVLIDTWQKREPGLLHWMSPQELTDHCHQAHAAGLTFALAGRLQEKDLPQLDSIGSDILGIRGAACRGNVRDATLDAEAVRHFKRQLAVPSFPSRPMSLIASPAAGRGQFRQEERR